jgi:CheY-like chemotaxis protein
VEAEHPRVLVVDDDALMGAMITDVLDAYRITFCQSASGALGRIQAGGPFSAVVCDLFLPGMSGFQFHAELVQIAPALAKRIVFLTASANEPQVNEFIRRTGTQCLAKPFRAQELRAAVVEASLR